MNKQVIRNLAYLCSRAVAAALLLAINPVAAQSSGAAAVGAIATNPAFPSQPNGKFTTSASDLHIKVPNGNVNWRRDYNGNLWQFNANWANLRLTFQNVMGGTGGGGGGGGGGGAVAMPTPIPESFGGVSMPGIGSLLGYVAMHQTGPLTWVERNGARFQADGDYGSFMQLTGSQRYLVRPLQQFVRTPNGKPEKNDLRYR